MPLYEYQCDQCGRFEIIQKFAEPTLACCPTCGKEVQKLPSAPAIQFKGSGWYITDYARKGEGGKDKDSGSKADGGNKADGGKAEGGKAEGGSKEGSSKSADSSSSTPQTSSSKDSSASGSSPTK